MKYNKLMLFVMCFAWAIVFTFCGDITYNLVAGGMANRGGLFEAILWLWVLMGVLLVLIPIKTRKEKK